MENNQKYDSAPPIQLNQNISLFSDLDINKNKKLELSQSFNLLNNNDNSFSIFNSSLYDNPNKINNLNKDEYNNINQNLYNDNYNKNNIKANNFDEINEKYMIRIGIKSNELKELSKENLIELIQFIDYSCNLTLQDIKYKEIAEYLEIKPDSFWSWLHCYYDLGVEK